MRKRTRRLRQTRTHAERSRERQREAEENKSNRTIVKTDTQKKEENFFHANALHTAGIA